MGILSRAVGYTGQPTAASSATGSTIPEWVNAAAASSVEGDSPYEDRDEGGLSLNPLRFAGNVIGDITEIAKGLGAFVGLGLTDAYHGIGEVVEAITPLENSDNDYYTDDVLKSLVFDPDRSTKTGAAGVWEDMFGGIKDDLVNRYVEPFKEEGIKGVAESIYEDPIYALGDVAAVGTIGGAGVASRAKSIFKTNPGVADELAKLGELKKAAYLERKFDTPDAYDEAGRLINPVDEKKVNAAVAAVEDAISKLSPEAAWVEKVLPGAGMPELAKGQKIALGGFDVKLSSPEAGIRPVVTNRSNNPFVRWEKSAIDKLLSSPRDKFVEKKIGPEIAGLVGAATNRVEALQKIRPGLTEMPSQTATYQALRRYGPEADEALRLVAATDRYGLNRIEYRPITRLRSQQAFDRLSGFYTTRFYGARDEFIQTLQDIFDEGAKEGADIERWIETAMVEGFSLKGVERFSRDEIRSFFARQADDGGDFAPVDLTPEETEALKKALPAGAMDDNGIVDIGNWGQSQVHVERAEQVLGPRVNAEMIGNKVVAATFSPDGVRQVRLRFQTPDLKLVTEAIEDWHRKIPGHKRDILHMENTKSDLITEMQRIAASQSPDSPSYKKAEERIAAIERQIDDKHDEIEAIEQMAEDYSVMARIDMSDGPVDPNLKVAAKVLIARHHQTIRPAQGRGKFNSARSLMTRAFLPLRLELHAHRSGKLLPLYDEFLDAMDSGDATRMSKATDKLREAGFAEPGEGEEAVLARILRDVVANPTTRKDAPDFVFTTDDYNAVAMRGQANKGPNQTRIWRQMSNFYRDSNRLTPLYYPTIDGRLTKPSEFLMKKMSEGWKKESKSSAPFKRAMGHVYVNGSYVRDPVDAYARRASQVRRSIDIDLLHDDIVEQTGRPLSRIDDLGPHEALMVPVILKRYLRTKNEFEEETYRLLSQGIDEGPAFAEGFRKAFLKLDDDPNVAVERLAHELFGEDTTKAQAIVDQLTGKAPMDVNMPIPMLDGKPIMYAVPKTVARRMDSMAKFHLGWKARIFWDGPLNVWRTLILAFSPRWIFNNLLGNITFLKMQGGNFNDALRLMGGKTARKFARMMGNDDWTPKFLARVEAIMNDPNMPDEIRVGIHGGFFSSTEQQIRHLGAAENTPYGRLIRGVQSEKVAKPIAKASAKMRRFNESIEESFRQASWLKAYDKQLMAKNLKDVGRAYFTSETTLQQIAKDGIDLDSAKRALDETNKFFNDYMKLGPYERNVIRRYIMPFYSFYKHMVKLLSQYPLTDPVRYQVLEAMSEVSKEMAAEFGPLPDWLTGSVPIGESGEDTVFLNSRGANPFSGLIEGPRGLLSGLSPQFRTGIEFATGEDIVTGKKFSSPDTFTPFGGDVTYGINPETMDVDPTTVRPGVGELVLGQFPQYDLIRDSIARVMGQPVGARYSTGETMINPETGEAQFPKDMGVSAGSWAGISRTPFNQTNFIERMTEDERAALIGWLRRNGLLPMPEETV